MNKVSMGFVSYAQSTSSIKRTSIGVVVSLLVSLSPAGIAALAQDRKWGEPVNLGHVHKPYSGEEDSDSTTSASNTPSNVNQQVGTASKKKTSHSQQRSNNKHSDSSSSVRPSSYSNNSGAQPSSSTEMSNENSSQTTQTQAASATGGSDPAAPATGGPHPNKVRNALKSIGTFLGTQGGALISSPNGANNSGVISPLLQRGTPQNNPMNYHLGSGIDSPYNIDNPNKNNHGGNWQAPAVSGGYDPAQNFLTPPKNLHQSRANNLGPEGALNFSSAPHSRGPFSLQGVVALNKAGNWNEMLDYSRAWVAQDPNSSVGWFSLGQSAYKLGNYDAAVAGFLKATQLTPTEPKPYNNLSAAYCKRGQFDMATKATMDGAWFCTKTSTAYDWYVFGNAFKDLGLAEAAEHAYRLALAKRPNFPEAQNNLGVVLFNEGDSDSADSWYQKAARGGNKLGAANHHSVEEARQAAAQAAKQAASGGYNMNGPDQGFYSPQAVALRRHQYQVATSGQGKGYGE
jgi:Tetratricopeptide repeat